jgi:phosphatidylglycerophosphate synthase
VSTASSRPSLAELREVAQPGSLLERRSDEHWAGRLYMRWLSLRVTRLLVSTRATPNALTLLMGAVGLVAAAVLAVPTLWAALLAALAIQLYLLLDCVDGELARWRRTTSAAGVYLDRLGHYVVETALVIGLGARASAFDGGIPAADGWLVLGLAASVLVLLARAETDLIIVARTVGQLPLEPAEGAHEPRPAGLRALRRVVTAVPFHRVLGAVELSLAALVAAVADVAFGGGIGTRALLLGVVTVATVVAVGHAIAILTSGRLR